MVYAWFIYLHFIQHRWWREKCSVQSTVAVSRKFLLTWFRLASSNIRACRFSKEPSILSPLSLPDLWFYAVWLKFRFFYAMSRRRTLFVQSFLGLRRPQMFLLAQQSTRRSIPEYFKLLTFLLFLMKHTSSCYCVLGTYLLALIIGNLTTFVVSNISCTPTEDDRTWTLTFSAVSHETVRSCSSQNDAGNYELSSIASSCNAFHVLSEGDWFESRPRLWFFQHFL